MQILKDRYRIYNTFYMSHQLHSLIFVTDPRVPNLRDTNTHDNPRDHNPRENPEPKPVGQTPNHGELTQSWRYRTGPIKTWNPDRVKSEFQGNTLVIIETCFDMF